MQSLKHLKENGLEDLGEEIQIIDIHHLLSKYQNPYEKLTEVLHRADLVNFSLRLVSARPEVGEAGH